jgi:hypothetical protein
MELGGGGVGGVKIDYNDSKKGKVLFSYSFSHDYTFQLRKFKHEDSNSAIFMKFVNE